jgi:hypothetical protein
MEIEVLNDMKKGSLNTDSACQIYAVFNTDISTELQQRTDDQIDPFAKPE